MKKLLLFMALGLMFLCYVNLIKADVQVLFDEEDDFLKKAAFGFTAGCSVENEEKDVYNGKLAIRVNTPLLGNCQAYKEQIPDWNFSIIENPKAGEYRYLTFAWKTVGEVGIMIQFPDKGAWGSNPGPCVEPPTSNGTRRYVDGTNQTGWGSICIDKTPPDEWRVYTRDLVEDFGEFVMTGMALTPFGTDRALYDFIILTTTKDEVPKSAAVSSLDKLASRWGEIKN